MAFAKYLEQYAEPEARGDLVSGPEVYSHVVVVPARAEEPSFVDGLSRALAAAPGRCLLVVVVNGRENDPPALHARNRETLKGLARRKLDNATLLVIDRATPGKQFPADEGVGLARKIGGDVALAAIARKRVTTPWIFMTDADVTLPEDYLRDLSGAKAVGGASAITFPFSHQEPGAAVALYEMSLRYYVLGLAWAGSPYAFHTVGSTMAVRADAYAAVRGVPRRQAGEDFYLLNKLAKVGTVWQPAGSRISILDRPSDRVPFGTGAARARIEPLLSSGKPFCVYHPGTFIALRTLLRAIDTFVETGTFTLTDEPLQAAARQMGIKAALEKARAKTSAGAQLHRRIHEWLDGFRTLKLIHTLRDQGLESLPWREAYERAPFLSVPTGAIAKPHIPSWQREMLYLENGHLPRMSGVRVGQDRGHGPGQGQGAPVSAATPSRTRLRAS